MKTIVEFVCVCFSIIFEGKKLCKMFDKQWVVLLNSGVWE